MVSTKFVPKPSPLIGVDEMDEWDYVVRQLFINTKTPLQTAITTVAPGAAILLKSLTNPDAPPEERADVTKYIKDLDIEEWAALVKAFKNWPFRPDIVKIVTAKELEDRAEQGSRRV